MKSFGQAWHNFFSAFAMLFSAVHRICHAADEVAKYVEDEAVAFNADASITRATRNEQLRAEAARLLPTTATP